MTTTTLSTATPAAATPRALPTRLTGALLLVEGLLIFVPMAILGPAINWPASLSDPAETMLPLLHAQLGPARLGYFIYLLYSVLFFPVALLTARVVARGAAFSALLQLGVGFAALSTLARCIGIIRWLVAMPALAAVYVDPATTPAARAGISAAYTALNAFGGSIGEALGVNLFAGLWLALLSAAILRDAPLPRWLGIFGALAAALLLGASSALLGVTIGGLIIATTTGIQLWFLAAGIVVLRQRRVGLAHV